MGWRYYIRLPLIAVMFVVVLIRNMFVLNVQAWNWTMSTMREVHLSATRNFKKPDGK